MGQDRTVRVKTREHRSGQDRAGQVRKDPEPPEHLFTLQHCTRVAGGTQTSRTKLQFLAKEERRLLKEQRHGIWNETFDKVSLLKCSDAGVFSIFDMTKCLSVPSDAIEHNSMSATRNNPYWETALSRKTVSRLNNNSELKG